MAIPDLDAPAWVSRSIAAKSPSGSPRFCVSALLISSFAFAGAGVCLAQQEQDQKQTQEQKNQDVAEAARQERARKQNQQKKSRHVYTAEDLKREQILSPEDRAQLEARKNQPAPPSASESQKSQDTVDASAVAPQGAGTLSPSANPTNVSLGDVARHFRRQKESQQLQRSAQFQLPFGDAPLLASPKAPAQPLVPPVVTVPPTVVNPAPRVVAPLRPFVKRSPFERPRVLLPPPAVTSPREVAPAPLTPRVLPTPRPARVEAIPPAPGKYIIVTVKPGDSLWKFAASRLGDGHRWQELLALNPGVRDPNLIQTGTQLVLPASTAAPHTPTKYTVRHGDTLWLIAETQLGHGNSWSCITPANPELRDANLIQEGQVLLIPASCKP